MMDLDAIIINKNDKTIYWRKLCDSDQKEVERLTKECFCKRGPMNKMLSKTYLIMDDLIKFICCLAVTPLKQNYSIGAYDSKHKDKLCAMVIVSHCQPFLQTKDTFLIEEKKPTEDSAGSQLRRFLEKVGEGLREHIGTSDYLMIEMVAVDDGYLNMGLMSLLLERLRFIAKDNSIRYISSVSSSYYAQRMNVKFGCKELKEVKYKDYVDKVTGKMPFKNPPTPHTSCKLMCLDLDELET